MARPHDVSVRARGLTTVGYGRELAKLALKLARIQIRPALHVFGDGAELEKERFSCCLNECGGERSPG